MEKRGGESLFVVFVILGLLVGQSVADFNSCYKNCFRVCVFFGGFVVQCAAKCLNECTFDTYSSQTLKHTDDFCKLGCATSLCTNLSTKLDPGRILGEAVSGDSPAESRMRGDLHVRFGGRGYPDPTIIMPLQCYLVQLYL
ncbi:hypothetical protein Ddye_011225 [Dipteronia dyeriana]|uniref:Thionin-like protein 2 n=1 Tax=Dipteronia dyeriana TaxID=168575 RepID=A0AAD9UBX0_9ROSI|nr:hypothetical protein Ddye_011225 [Dipteronia dyeriana]